MIVVTLVNFIVPIFVIWRLMLNKKEL